MITHEEHRVAVASKDGVAIADHLGAAPLFVVFMVKQGKVIGVERRENPRVHMCLREDSHTGCWEWIEELLPDVKVVISRGMGENVYVGLLRRDILPINTGEIDTDSAIRGYLDDDLDDDPRLIHKPRRRLDCDHCKRERQ